MLLLLPSTSGSATKPPLPFWCSRTPSLLKRCVAQLQGNAMVVWPTHKNVAVKQSRAYKEARTRGASQMQVHGVEGGCGKLQAGRMGSSHLRMVASATV